MLAEPASNLRRPALGEVLVDACDAVVRTPEFAGTHAPDVVLRLGAAPTSKALGGWLCRQPDTPHIVLSADGAWTDPGGVTGMLLPGPPAPTIERIAATLGAGEPAALWLGRWRRAGRAARDALAAAVAAETAPFEGQAVAALAAALPPDALLYAGNSLAIRAVDWFWPAAAPVRRMLTNRGANGIDGFVSSVLGAAASGDGPVLGLCGDLSFLHDVGGLLAAHRHGVRAALVVLDNDGGGIFDHLPVAAFPAHHEALFVTPHGLDLGALARAYGARHVRVSRIADLGGTVRAALATRATTVLHVPVDRAHSLAAHRRAWRRAAAALAATS